MVAGIYVLVGVVLLSVGIWALAGWQWVAIVVGLFLLLGGINMDQQKESRK